MITQSIWNQTKITTQETTDGSTFKTRDELRCYMWFLLLCCIENSLAIAGLLGILWQNVYDTLSLGHIRWDDQPLHKLTWDPTCHELFLMHMHSETDGIFVYKFTDSFSILLACVRVYCIQCNLLLLFYYLPFQETVKNQLKGNYV